jgi:uncharacterized protein (TIGR03084 family)
MTPTDVLDDLQAEQEALEAVLSALSPAQWLHPSAAEGWTVADVVLHLAQSEEAVVATAASALEPGRWQQLGADVDTAMDALVRAERTEPAQIFQRWRTARRAALAGLRSADPGQPLVWVAAALKPRTLATTRLAEHWAHALDVVDPLGIDYPDTVRLRHIAWLGHSPLPYAFGLVGEPAHAVHCVLSAPDGALWTFGPPDAASRITGSAGAFCRVGARRLAAEDSGLRAEGPHAATALRVLRNYAAT